jgi:hypothetical protein
VEGLEREAHDVEEGIEKIPQELQHVCWSFVSRRIGALLEGPVLHPAAEAGDQNCERTEE